MTSSNRKPRAIFTREYIEQALELSDRIGVAKAVIELGILENNFYRWRRKRDKEGADALAAELWVLIGDV